MVGVLLGLIVAAMLVVRYGWDSPRRLVAVVGWALSITALVALAFIEGAWGVAIGTVTGIAVALALVGMAGWRSPAKTKRPAREAPSIVIPRLWPDIARRVAVFVLVVPVAFVAAQWLTFGAQALARRGGMGDADTIALTLFLQPVIWVIVMTVQMTRATPLRMIAPPVLAAMLGIILWSAA